MTRFRMRVAAAVVTTCTLLGLGASAGASVAAAKSGCKYLKASEVEQVLGTDVKKGPKAPGPNAVRQCAYVPVDSALPASINLWVQLDGGEDAKIGYDIAKRTFADNVESIEGLGRKAFYVTGGINTAYLLKGDTFVYLQYVNLGGDEAETKDAVTELTKIVLGRV